MYFRVNQYQLYFDFFGLGIFFIVLAIIGASFWQLRQGRYARSAFLAALFIALGGFQLHRGYLVPDTIWLVILGSVESTNGAHRDTKIRELSKHWSMTTQTISVANWLTLSKQWGVCHKLWDEPQCTDSTTSQSAVGVAREILSALIVSNQLQEVKQ